MTQTAREPNSFATTRPDDPVRVLVVQAEAFARHGIRLLLDAAGILVVGEAADARSAIRASADLAPDVMVVDLELPDLSGLDVCRAVRDPDRARPPRFLAVTGRAPEESLFPALRAGVDGYVLKGSLDNLVPAVRAVAAGGGWIDPLAARPLMREVLARPVSRSFLGSRLRLLSRRELEVLDAAAQGYNNAGIAERLHIRETTVKSHMSSVLVKLDVLDRTAAVVTYLSR